MKEIQIIGKGHVRVIDTPSQATDIYVTGISCAGGVSYGQPRSLQPGDRLVTEYSHKPGTGHLVGSNMQEGLPPGSDASAIVAALKQSYD